MDVHTNGTTNSHAPGARSFDEDVDLLYSWMPPQTAPAPCPEAVFSLTIEGRLNGHKCLLTARGQTPEQFRANLAAIRGLLDPPAPPATQADTVPQCPQHGAMRQGKRGHYCPRKLADGTYCPSKGQ